MNTKHYPNRVILIFSPSPHMNYKELKQREWDKLAMPKALIILGLAVAGHLASVEVTLVMLDCS